MNSDNYNYDDPGQRTNVYADTGADEDRNNPNQTREGSVPRLNRTFPPPPSELQSINQLGVAENLPLNEPPISMEVLPVVAENQQRPFSNIYAATLPDTAVVSDFIIEQRATITSLIKKLRLMGIALAVLTILFLAIMGVQAYGYLVLRSISDKLIKLETPPKAFSCYLGR